MPSEAALTSVLRNMSVRKVMNSSFSLRSLLGAEETSSETPNDGTPSSKPGVFDFKDRLGGATRDESIDGPLRLAPLQLRTSRTPELTDRASTEPYQRRIAQLDKQLSDARERINLLNNDRIARTRATEQQLRNMTNEIDATHEELAQYKKHLTSAQEECGTQRVELEAVRSESTLSMEANTRSAETIASLNSRVAELQSTLRCREAQDISVARKEVEEQYVQIQTLQLDNARLKELESSHDATRISNLESMIAVKERRLHLAENECTELRARIDLHHVVDHTCVQTSTVSRLPSDLRPHVVHTPIRIEALGCAQV